MLHVAKAENTELTVELAEAKEEFAMFRSQQHVCVIRLGFYFRHSLRPLMPHKTCVLG
jgi:hypothetical protein